MVLQSFITANLVESIGITIGNYYPVNLLAKMQIYGYVRYPDSKNFWYPN